MTKEWDQHQQQIVHLYKEKNLTLQEVRRIMEQDYDFKASIRAFRSTLRRWKVSKYNRRMSATTIGSRIELSTANEAENGFELSPTGSVLESPSFSHPLTRFYSAPSLGSMPSTGLIKCEEQYSPVGYNLHQSQTIYPAFGVEPHHATGIPGLRTSSFVPGYLDSPYDAITEHAGEAEARTLLFEAIQQGDTQICRQLLDAHPSIVNARDGRKYTPLHVAARHDRLDVVKLLLQSGADVDARESSGCTAMHLAMSWPVCQKLLACNADPVAANYVGDIPLHSALRRETWWLNTSLVAMIRELLSPTTVHRANCLPETPFQLMLRGFPHHFDRVQADIIQQSLELHQLAPDASNPFPFMIRSFLNYVTDPRTLASLKNRRESLQAIGQCFQAFIDHGANLDVIIRDKPLLHHFLADVSQLISYDSLWPFVQDLTHRANLTARDTYGNNALHAILSSPRPASNNARVLENMRAAVINLVRRTSKRHINDRGASGQTPLQMYVSRWADDDRFWDGAANLVEAGADTSEVPHSPEFMHGPLASRPRAHGGSGVHEY